MNEQGTFRQGGRKRVFIALFILGAIATIIFIYWHLFLRGIISTSDARVGGQLLDLSSQISGMMISVSVTEGDPVYKGQLLFTLDQRPLESPLEKARAQLSSEQVALTVAETQYEKLFRGARPEEIEIAKAVEQKAATQARLAAAEWDRAKNLNDTNVLTRSDRDKIKSAAEAAKHTWDEAKKRLDLLAKGAREEDLRIARSTIQLRKAQLKAAKAAVNLAEVNLNYTEVYAPFDGLVVRRWQDPGAIVPAGRPVLTLFDPSTLHVSANIEEKNLGRIAVGNRVGGLCEKTFARKPLVGRT